MATLTPKEKKILKDATSLLNKEGKITKISPRLIHNHWESRNNKVARNSRIQIVKELFKKGHEKYLISQAMQIDITTVNDYLRVK